MLFDFTEDRGRIGLAMSIRRMEDTAAIAEVVKILPSAPILVEIPDLPDSLDYIRQLSKPGVTLVEFLMRVSSAVQNSAQA